MGELQQPVGVAGEVVVDDDAQPRHQTASCALSGSASSEEPAASVKVPASSCQPPSQCSSARRAIGTVTATSSPGSASTVAKPASQRAGRSTALSARLA